MSRIRYRFFYNEIEEMGIMGQYIAKTYSETKKRPHYIISESNIDTQKIR